MPAIDERPALSLDAVRPAADLSEAFVNIAEVVTPAVVRIETQRAGRMVSREFNPFRFFGPEPNPGEPELEVSGGSGFIISPEGYILTNNHVVEGASQVTVFLRDRRKYDARVIGGDQFTDVAVIKIDVDGELPHLSFGDSEDVQVGQWVLAVGNPGFGSGDQLDYSVTAGIVSARGRALNILRRELLQQDPDQPNLSGYAIEDFIQTDAVINPGNSGGPMVSLTGQVVGINSAIASNTGYYQGYGFAIPINLARRIMEDLIEYGSVKRPMIGVQMETVAPEDAEIYGLPSVAGALVQRAEPGGPAAGAGIRQGDVIVAVDGEPVAYSSQLQQRIIQHRPGDEVTLTVYRDKRPMEVRVRLGESPINNVAARPVEVATASDQRLGIRVEALSAEDARQSGYQPGDVVIVDVLRGSPADQRGMARFEGSKIAAIGGREIAEPADVRAALDAVRAGEVVSFVLELPDGEQQLVNVRMPAR
jgi:serine protease Do